MNKNSELSMLHELTYESRNIVFSFQREKNILRQIYGNKWLLCTCENGKIKVLETCNKKEDLEELGFSLCGNKLFDILNPELYTNYKNHYSSAH